MKIAIVQTNPVIGDFKYNCDIIQKRINEAKALKCDLAVFPELTLCGYPPQDLLERPAFISAHERVLVELINNIRGIAVVIGVLEQRQGPGRSLYNTALLIEEGKVVFRARKQLLPTYDVFDERRYFEPGNSSESYCFRGKHLILSVCEDIWFEPHHYSEDPFAVFETGIGKKNIDLLINISASPYYFGKLRERRRVFAGLCNRLNVPLIYVNQVGGQDSLLFDGNSMVMRPDGKLAAAAGCFREDLVVVESGSIYHELPVAHTDDSITHILEGLTIGVRDYLRKTGFTRAVLGLSGGIDSALTAVIACRALGPENVLCVAMPSPFTSQISIDDAKFLAANLGCRFEVVPIKHVMQIYNSLLAEVFMQYQEDVTEQNIQARIRGNILMALSNKLGHMLLSTGNKSEMAVGYCTLYGDMSGGLAVLADVPKAIVYSLARLINEKKEIIPARIIDRAPTAELKPGQFDQDDLPPYEILDPILTAYLENQLSVEEIISMGYDRRVVKDVIRRIKLNEYKRKQAPLGLKVTTKAFGHGRRYPVAQNFQE